jgi:hypothetical protein
MGGSWVYMKDHIHYTLFIRIYLNVILPYSQSVYSSHDNKRTQQNTPCELMEVNEGNKQVIIWYQNQTQLLKLLATGHEPEQLQSQLY